MDEMAMMASDDQRCPVWYCLMTPNGNVLGTTSLEVTRITTVDKFRELVMSTHASILGYTEPVLFNVYKNKDSLDKINKALQDKNKSTLDAFQNQGSQDKDMLPLDAWGTLEGLGITGPEALVVVVPDREVKRDPAPVSSSAEHIERDWTPEEGCFPRNIPLPFDFADIEETGEFCPVESKYHTKSGLVSSGEDMLLYCRLAFRHQAAFLQKCAITYDALTWVVGPPGSGKSCTAFAFALSLDPSEWNVIWIHYARQVQLFQCVRFEGDRKATVELYAPTAAPQIKVLLEREKENNKKLVVFLDGYVNWLPNARDAFSACTFWQRKDKERRRLVCICSMVSRGKECRPEDCEQLVARDGEKYLNPSEWASWSWSLEEYLGAVENDVFYNSVKLMLGSDSQQTIDELVESNSTEDMLGSDSQERKHELVLSKFFFAGGNARFMFGWETDVVINELEKALELVQDIAANVEGGNGDNVVLGVNSLLSSQWVTEDKRKATILSRFVGREIAIRFGPTMVMQLKTVLCRDQCPAMDGHWLARWFFSQLSMEDVMFWAKDNTP